jgi:hypothetical protein
MLVAKGDIQSLLKWFEESKYRILCLLVGGHLKSDDFFSEVFNNKEALDTISGSEIAIILFSGSSSNTVEFELNGVIKILPGDLQHGTRRNDIRVSRITDLNSNPELKAAIIKNSNSITSEISSHFSLTKNDLPCILLLENGNIGNPYIIHTHGLADVLNFYELLKEMASLLEKVPTRLIPDDNNYKWFIESEKAFEKAKTEYENSLDKLFSYFKQYKISQSEFESVFTLKNCKNIFQVTGFNERIDQPSEAKPYNNIFTEFRNNAEFKNVCRNVQKSSREYLKVERTYQLGRKLVTEPSYINKVRQEFLKMNSIGEELQVICAKREKNFKFKKNMIPLTKLFARIFGVAKKSQELLSISNHLSKLVEKG